MTTMSVVGEGVFWYQLTWVVQDNFYRAVKRLCMCVVVVAATTPPIYPGLGQAPNMLACIPGGLVICNMA